MYMMQVVGSLTICPKEEWIVSRLAICYPGISNQRHAPFLLSWTSMIPGVSKFLLSSPKSQTSSILGVPRRF